MYERYAGLIFDMDGTILDTEPTHRKAWDEVLGRYGLRFDLQAMVALNGSPTWRIAQSIIELNHADLDPHALAQEKTDAVKSMLLDSVEPLPLVEVVKAWYGRRFRDFREYRDARGNQRHRDGCRQLCHQAWKETRIGCYRKLRCL